jgi:SAM-dependent methyltransferase
VELARRVGPGGEVVGVDISAPMLERARENARGRGVTNVGFENADAQTHALPGASFDLLFSRFGVMFFAEPAAAFANLRRSLRPAGRLAFVCWQAPTLNPWAIVPLMAAAAHLPLPPPPAPDAPGPFAFADQDRVRQILGDAGFRNVEFESVAMQLIVGGSTDIDSAVEFLMQMGPTAAALRETSQQEMLERVAAAIREALLPYYVADEGVRMDAAAWVVTARP